MNQAWTVASGKGGVGRSVIAAALANALAGRQMPTVVVDGDIGLRSLDLILGVENKVVFDLVDVARRECKLRSALIRSVDRPSLSLLPASQIAHPESLKAEDWAYVISKLRKRFAYVLMDAPAGLNNNVKAMLCMTDQVLLTITPDDIAIRDAERLLAVLDEQRKPRPMLVVNRIRPEWVRKGIMYSPQTVANVLDVPLLGFIPEDEQIPLSIHRHETFMDTDCPAKEAMLRIVSRFMGEYVPMPKMEKWRVFARR